MATSIKTGSVVGTGAALNVVVGFVPSVVIVANTTDGDSVDLWFNGMPALTSLQISGTGATRAAPNGISAYAGSATEGTGFTIGAGISESGKTLFYVALEQGPGAG